MVCLRFGVGDEAVEPVAEDFSVGVEQDDGAVLAQAEARLTERTKPRLRSFSRRVEQAAAGEAASSR